MIIKKLQQVFSRLFKKLFYPNEKVDVIKAERKSEVNEKVLIKRKEKYQESVNKRPAQSKPDLQEHKKLKPKVREIVPQTTKEIPPSKPISQLKKSQLESTKSKTSRITIKPQPPKELVHIQIGIDFGTSFSKIAYRELGSRLITPLLFDNNIEYCPDYCIPSVVAIDDSRNILFGVEAENFLKDQGWDFGLRRIKTIVAGMYDPKFYNKYLNDQFSDYYKTKIGENHLVNSEIVASIFLARLMGISRNKLINLEVYKNKKLELSYNICVPIDYYENNDVLKAYEKIIALAEKVEEFWRLSNKGKETFNYINSIYDEVEYDPDTSRVFLVPEAVAEAASYLYSTIKSPGIHAIIDIGCGTTDISIFHLTRSNKDYASYYAADAIPRGTIFIEEIIYSYLKRKPTLNNPTEADVLREMENVDSIHLATTNKPEYQNDVVKEINKLWEYSHPTWRQAYKHLSRLKFWNSVKVFVCGGGADIDYMKHKFREPWLQNLDAFWPIEDLPEPDTADLKFNSLNGKVQFSRLAVACGLTIPKPVLDDYYILPKDCGDHTPAKPIELKFGTEDGKLDGRGWV